LRERGRVRGDIIFCRAACGRVLIAVPAPRAGDFITMAKRWATGAVSMRMGSHREKNGSKMGVRSTAVIGINKVKNFASQKPYQQPADRCVLFEYGGR